LEITLTSRPVSKGERVPLAGIPHHSLDSYLGKLISRGYKVAICEQVEPATPGRKLVERQVTRVVTPGTLIEDNLLPGVANNYLAALVQAIGDRDRGGIAYVDVSTGEFRCLEGDLSDVMGEISRLAPAELLVTEVPEGEPSSGALVTAVPGLSREAAVEALQRHLGVSSLDALGLGGHLLAAAAAGLVLTYLAENQPAATGHITRLTMESPRRHMLIDNNTQRNLELFTSLTAGRQVGAAAATLAGTLDRTKTPMGARLLRRWIGQPLRDVGEIVGRQEQVQFFFASAVVREKTAQILARVGDLERMTARISSAAAAAPLPTTPRDLVGLRRSLEGVSELRSFLSAEGLASTREVGAIVEVMHPCSEAVEVISNGIVDDPQGDRVIREGFSPELDELRSTSSDARQLMVGVEQRERVRTGIKSLKVGYNRVFGYYIEVSKANAGSVPEDYQRKQTLVGGERYTTPELADIEYRILHAKERQEELEDRLLRQVCAQVAAQTTQVLATAEAVAELDVSCSLAEVAARNGYVRPVVDAGSDIVVRDGRHPVVEEVLGPGEFVPNDIDLSTEDTQIVVLTGPNMAGKSTYLRQVALLVLMAQAGSFVPAAEARIGVVDRLFSRVGALDDIATGRSTFMVEMLETAAILHNATPRSLLVFDEIGRGTSTYDGMAIARAVVEFVHNRPDAAARCLFATHYHELTELATVLPRVKNYHVAVAEDEGRIVFLHRMLPGGVDRSYGVHVAQLAGLPQPVIVRAQEILDELEKSARAPRGGRREEAPSLQMALFHRDDGLAKDLAALDVDSLTPLQAITRLYELSERARQVPPPP
jgi:DNA mismatch repair protein MutS